MFGPGPPLCFDLDFPTYRTEIRASHKGVTRIPCNVGKFPGIGKSSVSGRCCHNVVVIIINLHFALLTHDVMCVYLKS